MRFLLIGIAALLPLKPAQGQEVVALPQPAEEIVVMFDESRTVLDDEGVHVEELDRRSTDHLRLPAIDTTGSRYFTLFYSRNVAGHEDDHLIDVLAIPHPEGFLLYADLNNDEDLRNDGAPRLLRESVGTVTLALVAPNDSKQVTHRTVGYVPTSVMNGQLTSDWFSGMMDDLGNLRPVFANLYGIGGQRGSFLFDDRPVLARGVLQHGDDTLAVGVYDWNANGRYDDNDDLLLIDLDRDGRLIFHGDGAHVFRLDDVFEVEGRRYRLNYVDPYGRGARLVEVVDPPTSKYLADQRAVFEAEEITPRKTHRLDSTFWDLELSTLNGDTLRLRELRGRPILLNIWGEWCSPCRVEMPALAEAERLMSAVDLQIVGLLATSNEAAARSYLKEIDANWPQAWLEDDFRERFDVTFYPTNLLITSEGVTAVEAGIVNLKFLLRHFVGQ